jgi:hypothetical protein
MSGETEQEPSGWTPDLLFLHLQTRLDANDRNIQTQIADLRGMLDERYTTQTKALDAAFVAAEKAMTTARTGDKEAIQAALLAAKEAVEKANTANEKRFENVNEFRGQLADMQGTLISRNEAESRFFALDEKIQTRFTTLDDQLKRIQSTVDKGFTGVDVRHITGTENRLEYHDKREDSRGQLALWVAGGSVLLTLILTILNAIVVHIGH